MKLNLFTLHLLYRFHFVKRTCHGFKFMKFLRFKATDIFQLKLDFFNIEAKSMIFEVFVRRINGVCILKKC